MFEKSCGRILRRAASALALAAMVAAAFAGSPDPKKLGYRQVAQNNAATVALLAQRIAAGATSGDPFLYLQLVAPDYAEATAGAQAQKLAGREALRQALSQSATTTLQVSHTGIESLSADEREASCVLVVSTKERTALRINLHFAKRPEGWVLVSSDGLSQFARAVTAAPQNHLAETEAATRPLSAFEENTAAHTFVAQELSSEYGIGKLTRALTQARLQRQLFSLPCASAFFARVQQFDTAPFLAASYVQLVTDPAWHRIVYGDYQKWIKAYDGSDSGLLLRRPHGIAVDASGFVYLADTGNRRVLVLKLSGPADQLTLSYVGTLGRKELSQPMEVAWDDRGTIFNSADDVIWVIDRGVNALRAYRAQDFAAPPIVDYRSEEFVTPAVLAIGRFDGRSDGNLYLADAGSRQLYRFYFDGRSLAAVSRVAGDAEAVPAGLATDHWGNVYLADASYRRLQKYSARLTLLATLQPEDETFQPSRFQPLFGSIALPGQPEPLWGGFDQAFLLEQWSENSGARRFELGIDFALDDLRLHEDLSAISLAGKLTDAGHLKTELIHDKSGAIAGTLLEGWMNAGEILVDYDRRNSVDELISPGYYRLRHTLQSTYEKPQVVRESAGFYLPLYYYEDCGAAPAHDAHLFRGTRRANFGVAAERTLATDPQAVVYRFVGLNPELTYEVKAGYFAALGEVEQALYAEQNLMQQVNLAAAGSSSTEWLEVPQQAAADGQLDLRILKTGGRGEAGVSEIWLREANFDANHPPQPDENVAAVPQQFGLEQNYPNPFNPTTTISFSLPEGFRGNVTLRIYNMLGAVVRELVQRDLTAGRYREVWDGLDASGRRVATGVYVYQLRATGFSATRKLLMMK